MKTNNNCSFSGCSCGVAGTILGLIFGIIIAILFSLGFTPLILVGVWVAFSIGALVLTYLLITALVRSCNESCCASTCLCKYAGCMLIGSIGTILAALAAVSITLDIAVTSIVVLIGVGTFFFVFMISALYSYLKCFIRGM